jgi:hypothetical protein
VVEERRSSKDEGNASGRKNYLETRKLETQKLCTKAGYLHTDVEHKEGKGTVVIGTKHGWDTRVPASSANVWAAIILVAQDEANHWAWRRGLGSGSKENVPCVASMRLEIAN